MARVKDLQKQLELSLAECARLREENARLRSLLGLQREEQMDEPSGAVEKTNCAVNNGSPAEEKVALFRSLFRGREDVYPVRWETKNGSSGYSPACRNEWNRPVCGKPGIKCAECAHRELLPVTDQVIYDHLSGKHTIGVYPLLTDETCWFLAADFDKASWPEDVAAFLQTCAEMGVPAALERSRSGNGGHVWIFFAQALPATLARKLGCALLTRTMEKRHQLGLDSYDRFFPNQDTLPKGGFGNLIALPLQRGPRQKGNTLYLDRNFQPYPDQWEYLSTLRRMPAGEAEAIVTDAAKASAIIGVRASLPEEDDEEDPWLLPPSKKKAVKRVFGPLPEKVRVVQSNLLYIEKEGLPPALLNRLIRLAAFQNPEFCKAQAMRLPTFGKPRIIQCADDFPRHVGLPHGCLDEVADLFIFHNIRLVLSVILQAFSYGFGRSSIIKVSTMIFVRVTLKPLGKSSSFVIFFSRVKVTEQFFVHSPISASRPGNRSFIFGESQADSRSPLLYLILLRFCRKPWYNKTTQKRLKKETV